LNVLDLFSGIGGFSLGLERAGMRTVGFCESDPFCRQVLAKHWPNVPCYDDIRTLTAARLAADGLINAALAHAEREDDRGQVNGAEADRKESDRSTSRIGRSSSIDIICGGFPCQDISVAGKGAGIAGERSGLWLEFARIIGELRPHYVIVENVSALLGRGLSTVLGDLAALGFDAEWHCIPASAVGAPHRRDRIWIIAYGDLRRQPQQPQCNGQSLAGIEASRWHDIERLCGDVAHAAQQHVNGGGQAGTPRRDEYPNGSGNVADADGTRLPQRPQSQLLVQRTAVVRSGWWDVEPDVGRVAHGVRNRVDRLRSLGNAVVPQIPEIIGRAIMEIEHPYDLDDDIHKSLAECYRAVKARKANGGKGWPA
jgi:DNA (cytosine-5)-methyltransferase 1